MKQLTDTVLMIEPVAFGFNEQTAASNSFQIRNSSLSFEEIQKLALEEFNTMVEALEAKGIEVIRFKDRLEPHCPDSIFPNNWFSTHSSGELITYPMATPNRRQERRDDIIEELQSRFGYTTHSLVEFENNTAPSYLEGTGSMVLDRENKLAYAAISERTQTEPLEKFCADMGYEAITFKAYDAKGEAIYHTNVLMCVAQDFVAIGMQNVDSADIGRLMEHFNTSNKELISLNEFQINHAFAGNMLQLRTKDDKKLLVISQAAYAALDFFQLDKLNQYNDMILPISIPTIEMFGGGSVRCMIGEVFRV